MSARSVRGERARNSGKVQDECEINARKRTRKTRDECEVSSR